MLLTVLGQFRFETVLPTILSFEGAAKYPAGARPSKCYYYYCYLSFERPLAFAAWPRDTDRPAERSGEPELSLHELGQVPLL
jgi:hypothetical protein